MCGSAASHRGVIFIQIDISSNGLEIDGHIRSTNSELASIRLLMKYYMACLSHVCVEVLYHFQMAMGCSDYTFCFFFCLDCDFNT